MIPGEILRILGVSRWGPGGVPGGPGKGPRGVLAGPGWVPGGSLEVLSGSWRLLGGLGADLASKNPPRTRQEPPPKNPSLRPLFGPARANNIANRPFKKG